MPAQQSKKPLLGTLTCAQALLDVGVDSGQVEELRGAARLPCQHSSSQADGASCRLRMAG